ncbi:hypothetical protein M404DRAFT_411796 [Pisolithus tinctorius Marx 270]|uniref:Uncharacterized protein n=1 Tax=Pisolithus tinctorius Marx 270 TaxID=870435 RepID=A0A0C3JEH2_PISTI|nr:hypothetical protein M404DRAFT_411796 [Pisolithus tinctorius Marx 270]
MLGIGPVGVPSSAAITPFYTINYLSHAGSRFQDSNFWNFGRADICVGVAAEGCQDVLLETCFATLGDDFSRDT